ncbi:efflux transporter outer membrane subunit [Thiovibrio sp. JS02]
MNNSPCHLVRAATLVLALLLSGCMLGPDFTAPETRLPGQWREATAETGPAAEELARWWTLFNDPTLTSLVERGLAANLDLKQAEARVRQARAARRIAGAGLGPSVDASGSYRRSRSPETDRGGSVTADLYEAGFDANWEIDLFGGLRRGIEAAEADLAASIEARRGVLVSLSAELASNYLGLRGLQEQVAIARKNLEAQNRSAELTRKRFRAGFASRLDLSRAEALAAGTAAQIPLLESEARQAIYRLSVLLAVEPAALLAELNPGAALPSPPPQVPAGLPSELLRRRPDIRGAEARLHAATARIGVAEADLFPRFSLTGALGLQNSDFGATFNRASRFWSIGPGINWRLFDLGSTRANIEFQKAVQEEDLLAYQQTVLVALQEVENALLALGKEQERQASLAIAVAASSQSVELAEKLYTAGESDYLAVLDARRSLHAAEDNLSISRRNLTTHLVALFKALGGGWAAPAEPGS